MPFILRNLFSLILFAIAGNSIYGSLLHELRTVYLVAPDLAGVELTQRAYYDPEGYLVWYREQNLSLSITEDVELGFHVPYIIHSEGELDFSRLGDLKVHLNFATDWFKSAGLFNYYLEYNSGSGPPYTDLTTHELESYGYPEWRTGLIFMRKTDYVTFHANLYYVFRGENEVGFFDGMAFNVFTKETWERALGFNYNDDRNFFYKGNFKNDNIEYLFAVNTDLLYPLVPFTELTFSHDFYGDQMAQKYSRRAPGSGYYRSQISAGTKLFLANDNLAFKTALVLPVGELSDTFDWALTLGMRLDF